VEDIDLVILDNLSTLLTSRSETASDAWVPMQQWLLRLRREGISVLLVLHAETNGRQRGTSRRAGHGDSLATTGGIIPRNKESDSKFILKNQEIEWIRLEPYHLKHDWRPWVLMDNGGFVGVPRTQSRRC
jgi:hypothetical protein